MPVDPKPVYPPPGPLGATDPTRWHLDSSDNGRVRWTYDKTEGRDAGAQSAESKYWLGLDLGLPALPDPAGNPLEAARIGFEFYKHVQSPDGHWAGEYGGPMFLIPGFVIMMYVTSTPVPEEWKVEVARYLFNVQRHNGPTDSGWGIHIEGVSTVLGTGLNYVACRLLGVPADRPNMIKARQTLLALGGASHIPSWGKFWLTILNAYDWSGNHPIPPEFWLLPTCVPVHPSRWWIHVRQVYLPMSYLYGVRFVHPLDELVFQLRQEIYAEPGGYDGVKDWNKCRDQVAEVDVFYPHHWVCQIANVGMKFWEGLVPTAIRKAGIEEAYKLVTYEDANTSYQGVGPVSGPMCAIVRWHKEGPNSEHFAGHVKVLQDFMWMSKNGMMVTGTNGSQLWDLSFIAQALCETGLAEEAQNRESVEKILVWLDHCQIRTNPPYCKEAYRHASKGAWPFSTKEQGYTVSDCTAEGLKAAIYLQELPFMDKRIDKRRLCDAVDVLLTMQNAGGGFASYELIRGGNWLETLNPAEVFGDIMVEHAYPECTTAVLTALTVFNKAYPDYRAADIQRTKQRAVEYIHGAQREDGSWFGSWAICFTYATMFALESLALNGETYANSDRAKRACEFLLGRQEEDGGWGETCESCLTGRYVHHPTSQVVQTAWAVLALLAARYPDPDPIVRGCRLIMSRQKPNGEWPQEAIEGIFNRSTAISYPNYKFSWTIWALGKAYRKLPGVKW